MGEDMEKYRIDQSKGLEFGVYTLGDHMPDPHTGKQVTAKERLNEIIEAAKLSEEAGVDLFGVGESHQHYFVTQAHTVVLAAIAQATNKIKIGSASTIISTLDPVRAYEDFATIDLISNGRAEIIAGRASRVGLYELLGYDTQDYEELFEEKFDLLLQMNKEPTINWHGEFRAPLNNAEIIPRPETGSLPIWRAVGRTLASAMKAGYAGVPMILATLGGPTSVFKDIVDAYRETASKSGYDPATLPIGTTGLFHVADTTQEAMRNMYPYVNEGMILANGRGFSKQTFAQAADKRNVISVGSPQEIIEKILYQHELFGHQRYLAQIDFGGMPFHSVMKNIEIIGTDILPAIRKYTV